MFFCYLIFSYILPYSDDYFGVEEAQVICRQLGFGGGVAFVRAVFGGGTGPIWLDNLRCSSSIHTRLHDCPHNGWGVHDCGHWEDAGVNCSIASELVSAG